MADYKIINNITPQQGIEMITIQNIIVNTSPSNFLSKTQDVVSKSSFEIPKPLLVAQAKKIKLKKSQAGILAVMCYFIKFGFQEGCFIKQDNYAKQLKKFGYKGIRRQQVSIICSALVKMGLVSRIRRHRRSPYEYQLTSLGEVYYEMQNPGYQKQAERRRDDWPDDKKPYIETDKNRTSQLRSSFNKSSYKNSWGKNIESKSFVSHFPVAKSQEQLDRDKNNEIRATQMAKEALEMEGLHDPYKNTANALQIDYEQAREYGSKLSSYTCYFRNKLNAN